MPFDPVEWLDVADSLAEQATSEASRRAAASRYYYAVWLKSLIALEASGLYRRSRSRDDHAAVARTLRSNRRFQAGVHLRELARLREHADYDEQAPFSEAHLARARDLASEVRRLSATDWAQA